MFPSLQITLREMSRDGFLPAVNEKIEPGEEGDEKRA